MDDDDVLIDLFDESNESDCILEEENVPYLSNRSSSNDSFMRITVPSTAKQKKSKSSQNYSSCIYLRDKSIQTYPESLTKPSSWLVEFKSLVDILHEKTLNTINSTEHRAVVNMKDIKSIAEYERKKIDDVTRKKVNSDESSYKGGNITTDQQLKPSVSGIQTEHQTLDEIQLNFLKETQSIITKIKSLIPFINEDLPTNLKSSGHRLDSSMTEIESSDTFLQQCETNNQKPFDYNGSLNQKQEKKLDTLAVNELNKSIKNDAKLHLSKDQDSYKKTPSRSGNFKDLDKFLSSDSDINNHEKNEHFSLHKEYNFNCKICNECKNSSLNSAVVSHEENIISTAVLKQYEPIKLSHGDFFEKNIEQPLLREISFKSRDSPHFESTPKNILSPSKYHRENYKDAQINIKLTENSSIAKINQDYSELSEECNDDIKQTRDQSESDSFAFSDYKTAIQRICEREPKTPRQTDHRKNTILKSRFDFMDYCSKVLDIRMKYDRLKQQSSKATKNTDMGFKTLNKNNIMAKVSKDYQTEVQDKFYAEFKNYFEEMEKATSIEELDPDFVSKSTYEVKSSDKIISKELARKKPSDARLNELTKEKIEKALHVEEPYSDYVSQSIYEVKSSHNVSDKIVSKELARNKASDARLNELTKEQIEKALQVEEPYSDYVSQSTYEVKSSHNVSDKIVSKELASKKASNVRLNELTKELSEKGNQALITHVLPSCQNKLPEFKLKRETPIRVREAFSKFVNLLSPSRYVGFKN